MVFENRIIEEDLQNIVNASAVDWSMLQNTTLFITGATGLIGQNIVKAICYANSNIDLNCKIIALIRNEDKARKLFDLYDEKNKIEYIIGNVESDIDIRESIDYIIHCASQTSSKGFVTKSVETINTAVEGTNKVLNLALEKKVRGMIFTSSMEVYGYPERGKKVTEDMIGALSPLVLRNCYPLSKMLSESLCCAYANEYDLPVKIVRLTQTFGPGVQKDDNRIFAYISRCVINHENIILKTKGETERSYLYTADAVTALLTVLLKGEKGTAYNAADEETYCSIADMSEKVADNGDIKVEYILNSDETNCYANTLYMDLDTSDLKDLGWKKLYNKMDITSLFSRLIESMR